MNGLEPSICASTARAGRDDAAGRRIGEAANPGPPCAFDEPDLEDYWPLDEPPGCADLPPDEPDWAECFDEYGHELDAGAESDSARRVTNASHDRCGIHRGDCARRCRSSSDNRVLNKKNGPVTMSAYACCRYWRHIRTSAYAATCGSHICTAAATAAAFLMARFATLERSKFTPGSKGDECHFDSKAIDDERRLRRRSHRRGTRRRRWQKSRRKWTQCPTPRHERPPLAPSSFCRSGSDAPVLCNNVSLAIACTAHTMTRKRRNCLAVVLFLAAALLATRVGEASMPGPNDWDSDDDGFGVGFGITRKPVKPITTTSSTTARTGWTAIVTPSRW